VTVTNGTSHAAMERTRFFPRQLIAADDLNQEQHYHRQKLRNHNRFLHGWGVVCGCDVQPSGTGTTPWEIRVCPGYVLTPQGDEVWIGAEVAFDVATCVLSSDDPCAYARPCPPITRRALETRKIFLAVRHMDCHARPVRVAPMGCSCDDVDCEYSRIRDGYELCCLADLPSTHKPPRHDCAELFQPGAVIPCPTDTDDPWVVLATIQLPETETARITDIDIESDRRVLYSTARLQAMVICAAPQLRGTWHSVEGDVYHDNPRCRTGNNIEPANARPGTGGLKRCAECARLEANR
jgi:hypothetical protein